MKEINKLSRVDFFYYYISLLQKILLISEKFK